jgi:hypothetical protein
MLYSKKLSEKISQTFIFKITKENILEKTTNASNIFNFRKDLRKTSEMQVLPEAQRNGENQEDPAGMHTYL